MSWTTKEKKGDLAMMGLQASLSMLSSWTENNQRIKEKAFQDNKITDDELQQILQINDEYTTRVNNLLYDTELGCKFKQTEEIFIMIVEIIMLDLEHDYHEIIANFTNAIDTEEFLNSHNTAWNKREERLNNEYQEEMVKYETLLVEYNHKIKERNSKNFFSKLFAEDIPKPVKPERRS